MEYTITYYKFDNSTTIILKLFKFFLCEAIELKYLTRLTCYALNSKNFLANWSIQFDSLV